MLSIDTQTFINYHPLIRESLSLSKWHLFSTQKNNHHLITIFFSMNLFRLFKMIGTQSAFIRSCARTYARNSLLSQTIAMAKQSVERKVYSQTKISSVICSLHPKMMASIGRTEYKKKQQQKTTRVHSYTHTNTVYWRWRRLH